MYSILYFAPGISCSLGVQELIEESYACGLLLGTVLPRYFDLLCLAVWESYLGKDL